jgi:hypothetical protein
VLSIAVSALGASPLSAQAVRLAPASPATTQPVTGVRAQPSTPPTNPTAQPAPAAQSTATTPGTAAQQAAAGQPTPEEIAALKEQYESLPGDRQDEMKAYYKDLGLDLDGLLGLAAAASAEAARLQQTLGTLRGMDFTRTPQNVLAARSKIGFGQVPHPNPATAPGQDVAKWIHLQAMAGEWRVLHDYLSARPTEEAQGIYSQIIQSLNRGGSNLLPEEVLALAEICPEEPKGWQVAAWAAMLKAAAERNSPGPMLAKIKTDAKFFGDSDAAKRRRTVEFLAGGGLVVQAYEYLPPLEEARAANDGDLILVHGLYQADLAERAGESPRADEHRSAAWDLLCEAALAERATMETRREAIERNVKLMSRIPRSRVTPWLRKVFADDALGPAALEVIALSAAAVAAPQQQIQQGIIFGMPPPAAGGQQGVEERAAAILSLKEAVDVLLEREGLDQSVLRVPMRMLTTALVVEMENTIAQKVRQRTVAREAQLLLRAIPSKAWFDALEPSLATRADNACVGIATVADETDLALSLLADAVRRTPSQAIDIADAFLKLWEQRLSPRSDYDENVYIFYYWRQYVTQAPLTRGRQRRNLERLGRLMRTLEEIGVDPRTLPSIASAFRSCHGVTEVYELADIERVFGPTAAIPPATAAAIAQSMAASLNGDWRNRAAQVKQGVKRTDSEIAQLVDKGYGVAIELIDSAIANQPESWRYAVAKAGLSYDRMQFRAAQGNKAQDAAKDAEYRAAAFAAFEDAARRYAQAVTAGQEREDIGVYERWFGAAMGTAQLNFLNVDELPAEGTAEHDQVDRIREAIGALPPDAAFRHISDFARAIGEVVTRCDPEVKPKLVKQALRIVGDHPAGASLRGLDELYRDLVKDEIKLRLTIDGDDSVGANRQFGLMISLRFTNAVDRETGGFSKYLQTAAWVRVGRTYQEVNFREKLQKNIESSLAKGFAVESIGFFDPFMPPEGVVETGQAGWFEKPLAYVILSRTDPAVDRIPQLTMDMQFEDQTGPVTLVLPSNTPPVAVASGEPPARRPCKELQVTQVVDPRDARDGEGDESIKLEVICRGKGAMPDLREVLVGIDNAIAGYRIDDKGIETRPPVIMLEGDVVTSRYYYGPPKPPEGGYPERDDNGIYRLPVERSWTITYVPAGGSRGDEFRVPSLKQGVDAALVSRYFSDLDLEPVTAGMVPVHRDSLTQTVLMSVIPLLVLSAGVYSYRRLRRRTVVESAGIAMPTRLTPLSAVMTLRRIAADRGPVLDEGRRDELERDIAALEQEYFGPGESTDGNGDLKDVLQRWSAAVRSP